MVFFISNLKNQLTVNINMQITQPIHALMAIEAILRNEYTRKNLEKIVALIKDNQIIGFSFGLKNADHQVNRRLYHRNASVFIITAPKESK
ncbi:hypothetical protein CCP2SC5_600016 [Azospirillaceae bacterium]